MRGLEGANPSAKSVGESFAFMSNHTVFTIDEDLEVVSKLDFFIKIYATRDRFPNFRIYPPRLTRYHRFYYG